jgi:hypothetical protein
MASSLAGNDSVSCVFVFVFVLFLFISSSVNFYYLFIYSTIVVETFSNLLKVSSSEWERAVTGGLRASDRHIIPCDTVTL